MTKYIIYLISSTFRPEVCGNRLLTEIDFSESGAAMVAAAAAAPSALVRVYSTKHEIEGKQ